MSRNKWTYYNDNDPSACAWVRELIASGIISDGEVDNRSITDVQPDDIRHFRRAHFFCGIAGWDLALRLAGWGSRPVWTGSCPCQPFSCAGRGKGVNDERHLWPAFFSLIRECQPVTVFGEQVAAAIGKGWLDGISADLEGTGYACGALVLGAHSVGAPHRRQRLYWVADSKHAKWRAEHQVNTDPHGRNGSGWSGEPGGLDDSGRKRDESRRGIGNMGCPAGEKQGEAPEWKRRRDADSHSGKNPERVGDPASGGRGIFGHETQPGSGGHADGAGVDCWLGDTSSKGLQGRSAQPGDVGEEHRAIERTGDSVGFWSDSILHPCRDGKLRRIPVESALFPLSSGLPYHLARRRSIRPALLKGAGNAIVPQCAEAFIRAYLEVTQ